MAFRKILVPIDGSDIQRAPLSLAFALAGRYAAAVDVLHARIDPTEAASFVAEGMSGEVIQELIDLTAQQSVTRASAARAMFEAACAQGGISEGPPAAAGASARYIEELAREEEAVVRLGRLADLTVVSRPAAHLDPATQSTLNASLFESGHPVLVPAKTGTEVPFRHVLIAWNGSAEAARAVSCALPLLVEAETVAIAASAADPDDEAAAEPLIEYLGLHSVVAGVHQLPEHHAVGEALLDAAVGFDLMVMGAYTHSRLWQLILGGVTRQMLEQAPLALFMAH
ncbi:MAG: universal stress protein [Rhodospirillales bacterium]